VLPFLDGLDAKDTEKTTRRPHHESVCRYGHVADLRPCRARCCAAIAAGRRSHPPPFTATLSNNTPLAFGMDEETAARAARHPAQLRQRPPGRGIYLTFRNLGAADCSTKRTGSTCNSARSRLVGWKGDWGHNWMWQ